MTLADSDLGSGMNIDHISENSETIFFVKNT
jgi:hypothetical protein